MHISLFQDSEETVHSAEINDTFFEQAACFHGDEAIFFFEKKNQNDRLKKASFSIFHGLVILSHPFFFSKKKKLLHLNENKQPVHVTYHLFLQYGWFLQNLGKDFIGTNMHMTVEAKTVSV